MVVSFFGHAKFIRREDDEKNLLALLEEKIGGNVVDFYLGGYGDFDDFAYTCCKKYKESHPRASLIFISPYMTIEYQKNHLQYQKSRYDEIIYPDIENKPLKFAISYRNKWMVEKSDFIVCFISHDWGGAYQSYKYARRKKKQIFNLTGKAF